MTGSLVLDILLFFPLFICVVMLVMLIVGFIIMFLKDFLKIDIIKYIKDRKKNKIARKEELAKKKSEKLRKKKSKRYDSYTIKVLEIQFDVYVQIIENILEEVCMGKKYRINKEYLIRLFDYFSFEKFEIYSVEGIYFLLKSIKEWPIIDVINQETYTKNIEILEKLITYDFAKIGLKYQGRNIRNDEVSNILFKFIKYK